MHKRKGGGSWGLASPLEATHSRALAPDQTQNQSRHMIEEHSPLKPTETNCNPTIRQEGELKANIVIPRKHN